MQKNLVLVVMVAILSACSSLGISDRKEVKAEKDGRMISCDKPPADVLTNSVTISTEIEAVIASKTAAKGHLTAGVAKTFERVRDEESSTHSFEIIEYRLCRANQNGRITNEEYKNAITGLIDSKKKSLSSQPSGH